MPSENMLPVKAAIGSLETTMRTAIRVVLGVYLATVGVRADIGLADRLRSAIATQRAKAAVGIGASAAVSASRMISGEVTQKLRGAVETIGANTARSEILGLATYPQTAVAALKLKSSIPAVEIRFRDSGTIRIVQATDLKPGAARRLHGKQGVSLADSALEFVAMHRELFGLKDPASELLAHSTQSDGESYTRLLFNQAFNGLPVWPAQISAHFDASSRLVAMMGAYIPTPVAVERSPTLSPEQAVQHARRRIPQDWIVEVNSPELVIYAPLEGEPRLAWKCEFAVGFSHGWRVVVADDDGRTLLCEDRICEVNVLGRGTDMTGTLRPLNVWKAGATHYLIDTSKPSFAPTSDPLQSPQGVIAIWDAQNKPLEQLDGNITHVTSGSAVSWAIPAAVSAAFNFSETFDYFYDRHGRNSLDNAGGNISAIVRAAFDNAFWNGTLGVMVFGNAKPYPASLDVVAHELSHGVTEKSAELIYENQSGALNEAFSDIFGEMAEARSRGRCDWLVGSELPSPIRDMRNPEAMQWQPGRPYPKRMGDYVALPNTDAGDHGGVHINSSIINHAFYLLAEGLPAAVGLRDAERILYRTLTQRLLPQSQFIDARLGAIASAEELFGIGSVQARKTAEAFDTVQILDAPGSPEPSPVPVVPGQDSNLHLYETGGIFGASYDLYRHEAALGDDVSGRRFTSDVELTRPAVTGNGQIAMFVTGDHDLGLAATDDVGSAIFLGLEGLVHSAAISPDGRWVALVSRNPDTGEPMDEIGLFDLVNSTNISLKLVSPTIDGTAVDQILYADAMTFTTDSKHLVYDALSRVRFASGSALTEWSIFSIEIASGTTSIVIPPIEGISTGNPAVGRSGNRYLVLDARSETDGQTGVFVMDLFSGDGDIVTLNGQSLAYPCFTGDESAVVYSKPDGSLFGSGFSLYRQPLAPDRLTTIGTPTLFQSDARLGVVYRRGTFVGTNALPTVTATLSTNRLVLPGSVLMTAHAVDSDGNVRRVEFFAGATSLGIGIPGVGGTFSFTWKSPTPGTHRVIVRATDNLGGAGDSTPVELVVQSVLTGPTVRVVSVAGQTIHLEVNGLAGSYELQRSYDLRNWELRRDFSLNGTTGTRLDEPIQNSPRATAFYRIRRL